MKVVAMLGSPHKNGPSGTIAMEVLRGAKDAGHEVVIYNVNDMSIKGCQGCRYCQNNYADCILEDDLKPYWSQLHEAGALVVSAPNYASQVCGQMITYMNRHYCLVSSLPDKPRVRVHPGIKLVGVFSQGAADPERYMEQYRWFMGDFQNRDMELLDILVHAGKMPYDADSEIMKRAYALGRRL